MAETIATITSEETFEMPVFGVNNAPQPGSLKKIYIQCSWPATSATATILLSTHKLSKVLYLNFMFNEDTGVDVYATQKVYWAVSGDTLTITLGGTVNAKTLSIELVGISS